MIPISKIKVSDQFQNPMFAPEDVIYMVEDIDAKEKVVLIQGYSAQSAVPISSPFWKRNTDRIFSESWRVFK